MDKWGSLGNRSSVGIGLPGLEIYPRFWAVIQDLIDLSLQFGSPLLHHFQGLQRILQLSRVPGSNQGGIKMFVLDGPGNRQMSQFAAQFLLGKFGKSLETGNTCGIGEVFVEEVIQKLIGEVLVLIIEPIHLSLSNALQMSACQETTCKGTPCHQTIPVVLIEIQVLDLIFRTTKHVVLILGSNRLMQIQFLADIQGIQHHLCIPVGSSPVKDVSGLDGFMETTTDLLNRGEVVLEVCVEDVDVVQLQSLEGTNEAFLDVLAGDEVIGVDVLFGSEPDLSGNNHLLSGDVEVLQDLSQLCFSLAAVVCLGGVEVVDAIFQSDLDDLLVNGVGLLLGVDHISEGDDGGKEAGFTEVSVGHLAGLEGD